MRFFLLSLSFFTTPLFAGTPRVALAHFEKDLQKMAKSSTVSVKAGSFVDRLASKRHHKEAKEQDIAQEQHEIDVLKQEIAQYEILDQNLARVLSERNDFLQQRIQDFEVLTEQLAAARESLQPVTPQVLQLDT